MAGADGGPDPYAGLDTSVAHPARVYDYWLGGTNNFPADREAAERVLAATPGLRFRVRANRAFLGRAAGVLDFGQPVAVMLLGVLHLIADDEDPWGIVARLMDAVPAGSYLTISHPAIDIHAAQAAAQRAYNERVATPQTLRTREQVARFFTGLDLVEPGLVQVHQWRPDPGDAAPADAISAHGAVGRKLCDHAPGDRKAAPITGRAN